MTYADHSVTHTSDLEAQKYETRPANFANVDFINCHIMKLPLHMKDNVFAKSLHLKSSLLFNIKSTTARHLISRKKAEENCTFSKNVKAKKQHLKTQLIHVK